MKLINYPITLLRPLVYYNKTQIKMLQHFSYNSRKRIPLIQSKFNCKNVSSIHNCNNVLLKRRYFHVSSFLNNNNSISNNDNSNKIKSDNKNRKIIRNNFSSFGGGKGLLLEKRKVSDATKEKEQQINIMRTLLSHIWPSVGSDSNMEEKKHASMIKRRVLCSLSLMIGGKMVTIYVPYIFKDMVDSLSITSSNIVPNMSEATVAVSDMIVSNPEIPIALVLGYGISRTTSSFMQELRNAVFAHVAQDTIKRVGVNAFKHILALDLNYHLNRNTGQLTRVLDRGNRSISYVLNAMVFQVVPTTIEVSVVTGLMAYQFGLQHSLVILGTIFSYCAFTVGITTWRTQFRRDMNQYENKASSRVMDSLLNYETIKYYNNEKHESNQYKDTLQQYQKAARQAQQSLSLLNFGQNAIFSIGLTSIMYLTSYQIITGDASIGDLVLVNGLLFQLSIPLNFIGGVYRETKQAFIDMEHMFALLDEKPTLKEQNKSNLISYEPIKHGSDIHFNDVSFSYPVNQHHNNNDNNKGRNILQNLSFHIPKGKTVAFVGSSGCGKSTILRLLYRFYDPTNGTIQFGNSDYTTAQDQFSISSIRENIAVIPQDTILFNDTIGYNIHYANFNASFDDVINVAKKAQIHDTIIKQFPNGYDTIVGERGLKLSGGEKQRVSIARALLKKSSIILCDEPTSSLDNHTELEIMKNLKNQNNEEDNTTMILVAHRLSTIQDCDIIFVLENGTVVEYGTHQELLLIVGGKYTALLRMQQQQDIGE